MKPVIAAALCAALCPVWSAHGQQPIKIAPGTPVNIVVSPPSRPHRRCRSRSVCAKATPRPSASASRTPAAATSTCSNRHPIPWSPMTGVAVAGASSVQGFRRGAGLRFGSVLRDQLRQTRGQKAQIDHRSPRHRPVAQPARVRGPPRNRACATVSCGPAEVSYDLHAAGTCRELRSRTCRSTTTPGRVRPVAPGKYTLHQSFHVVASHPHSVLPCKAASAEFAPDPALDPLWISYWEPFHGASQERLRVPGDDSRRGRYAAETVSSLRLRSVRSRKLQSMRRSTSRTHTGAAAGGWPPLPSRACTRSRCRSRPAVNTSPCSKNSWSRSRFVSASSSEPRRLRHLGQLLRLQVVNVLVERLARLDLVLDAVEHRHQHRRERQVRIAGAVGDSGIRAAWPCGCGE